MQNGFIHLIILCALTFGFQPIDYVWSQPFEIAQSSGIQQYRQPRTKEVIKRRPLPQRFLPVVTKPSCLALGQPTAVYTARTPSRIFTNSGLLGCIEIPAGTYEMEVKLHWGPPFAIGADEEWRGEGGSGTCIDHRGEALLYFSYVYSNAGQPDEWRRSINVVGHYGLTVYCSGNWNYFGTSSDGRRLQSQAHGFKLYRGEWRFTPSQEVRTR